MFCLNCFKRDLETVCGLEWLSHAMLITKSPADVTPEVNLKIPVYTRDKACTRGFETQDTCCQKSKIGVSVAPRKKTDLLQMIFLKGFWKQIKDGKMDL